MDMEMGQNLLYIYIILYIHIMMPHFFLGMASNPAVHQGTNLLIHSHFWEMDSVWMWRWIQTLAQHQDSCCFMDVHPTNLVSSGIVGFDPSSSYGNCHTTVVCL